MSNQKRRLDEEDLSDLEPAPPPEALDADDLSDLEPAPPPEEDSPEDSAPTPASPPIAASGDNGPATSTQQAAQEPEEPSALQRFTRWLNGGPRAAIAGALGGYTFGFADELAARIGTRDAVLRDALERGQNPEYASKVAPPTDMDALYRAQRDFYRLQEKKLKEEHPEAYYGAGVVGSLLTPNPIPRLGAATNLSRMQAAVRAGTLGGALNALGNSEAELAASSAENEPGRAAFETAVGGVTGGVTSAGVQKAFDWAGDVVPRRAGDFADWLSEKYAPIRALKAAGATKNDLKPIFKANPDKAYEMGRVLLDEDVIPAFANAEGVADAIEPALRSAGMDMGAALREADATGAKFDLGAFLDRIEQDLIQPNAKSPGISSEVRALQGKVDEFREMYPGGLVDYATANRLKSDFAQGQVNWGNHWNNIGPTQFLERLRKQFVGIFNDSIESQLEQAAGADTRAAFEAAKARYGPLAWAMDTSGRGRAGELGNDVMGLKDMQIAQAVSQLKSAANSENPLGNGFWGAAAALGSKLVRERGSSTAAVGADRLSQSDMLRSIATLSPQDLGPWGERLTKAITRGPGAFELEDYLLAQTVPQYAELRRRALMKAQGDNPDSR